MREAYKSSHAERSLRSSRLIKGLAGAALSLALFPAAAVGSHHEKPRPIKSPAAKMADRLEKEIIRHPQAKVSYDATHDLYWGKTRKGIFRYRTEVPLTARVGARNALRYFGVRNEGEDRRGLDVFPIPADALKAESKYDGFFHGGTDPSNRGTLQLDPDTHLPTTLLTYSNGEPSIRVNVGKTRYYGGGVILIPPAHSSEPVQPPPGPQA